MMMRANAGLANKMIERILELSADAHIRRRGTIKDSPEFNKLTGAIAAYGKTLALLTALQRRGEFYVINGAGGASAFLRPAWVGKGRTAMWRKNCRVCRQPMAKEYTT